MCKLLNGIIIRVTTHFWHCKKKETLKSFGVNNTKKNLVVGPSYKLIGDKFLNKIKGRQTALKHVLDKWGFKISKNNLEYLIPAASINSFRDEWSKILVSYDTLLGEFQLAYETEKENQLKELRLQAQAIKDENPNLPEDYVEAQLRTCEMAYIKTHEIPARYAITLEPHPLMELLQEHFDSDKATLLDELDDKNSEFVRNLVYLAKCNNESLVLGHQAIWRAEIKEKLQSVLENCDDPNKGKLDGRRTKALTTFILVHREKEYFNEVKLSKQLELLQTCVVEYNLDSTANAIHKIKNKILDIFKLLGKSEPEVEVKQAQATAVKREVYLEIF